MTQAARCPNRRPRRLAAVVEVPRGNRHGCASLQAFSTFPPSMRAAAGCTLARKPDRVPAARRAQRIQEKP
jgi:hypothetical protein